MLTIRPEISTDIDAIAAVHSGAFGNPGEAALVGALRDTGAVLLSLVAEREGEIVGHILFSPATVVDGERSTPIAALGPMAVLPDHQRAGIGTTLVVEGLRRLRERGEGAVAVLGHADYYPRFGFSPSLPRGITCEYPVTPEHFMVIELSPGALDGIAGVVRYHPAFAAL